MIVFRNKYGVYISFDTQSQNDCENSVMWVWDYLNPNSPSNPPEYSVCPSSIFYEKQLWNTLVDPCRPFQKTPNSKNSGDESYIRQFINFCVAQSAPLFAQKIDSQKYIDFYCEFWSKRKQFLDFFKVPPKSKWEIAKERTEKKIKIAVGLNKIKDKKRARNKRDEEIKKEKRKRLNPNN